MPHCTQQPKPKPDRLTGERHRWTVSGERGAIRWQGYTGPVCFSAAEWAGACRCLFGIVPEELPQIAQKWIEPVAAPGSGPRLFLHSTTPSIRAFEADLSAMAEGRAPLDLTTYTETRALYLTRPGDLAVGRTRAWRMALEDAAADGVVLDNTDHYYLSQALVDRACTRGGSDPSLARIIKHLRENPAGVISVYSLEPEMQLLLAWLAREAGIPRVRVDSNHPEIASGWNRKRLLHPTVEAARSLDAECAGASAAEILELEQRASEAFVLLQKPIPVLPGYTIPFRQRREDFIGDLLQARDLLKDRHGLSLSCLKPSEGGDGSRITPGINLAERDPLSQLGSTAWADGGDYVLEAHLEHLTLDLGGERVLTTPSAHVRDGQVLEGLTLQFMRGTSWKGNIFADDSGWASLGLPADHYGKVVSAMASLGTELIRRGLNRGGIDFGIGRIGGRHGSAAVVAVQDLNIKLPGAAFLHEFIRRKKTSGPCPAATRVFRPRLGVNPEEIRSPLGESGRSEESQLISLVPGRWGMLATTGSSLAEAASRVLELERKLIGLGLACDWDSDPG